jgi:hypothetical protein
VRFVGYHQGDVADGWMVSPNQQIKLLGCRYDDIRSIAKEAGFGRIQFERWNSLFDGNA